MFYGCIISNKKPVNENRPSLEKIDCVNLILTKDDSLGKIRNHACETLSLSETIKQYTQALDSLNFENCPSGFTNAFNNHIDAWTDIIQVTNHYPYLRGEMHDLFDKLEAGEHGDEFKPLLKNIWDTWKRIESAKNEITPYTIAYEIPEIDLVPEGLAYNPKDQSLFIGSTWKRKILKIDSKGQVTEFVKPAQGGILGVIGMKVDEKRQILWVCTSSSGKGMPVQGLTELAYSKSGIFKFDLKTGTLLQKFWMDEPGKSFFFNDLTIDKEGRVYATEMRTRCIYTVGPNAKNIELFLSLPQGASANGIDIDDSQKYLFVSLYGNPRTFRKINISTKQIVTISLPPNELVGADGLYFYNNSLIAVQPHRKNRVVAQYLLNNDLDKVEEIKVLMYDNSAFNQPTTGIIKDNEFYFIANSQLQLFAHSWRENNEAVDSTSLETIKIVKVGL